MYNLDNLNGPTRERIFALLKSESISQKEFAEIMDLPPATITDWKKGRSYSFTKMLPKIAEALRTTEEYLKTGNELYKTPESYEAFLEFIKSPEVSVEVHDVFRRDLIETLHRNILEICQIKQVDPLEALRESGAGESLLQELEKERKLPTVERVQWLARYFGVTTNVLLGEEKPTPATGDGLSEEMLEVIRRYDAASPELRAAALAVLRSGGEPGKGQDSASTGK